MEPSPLDSLLEAAGAADPASEERPAACGQAADQEPAAEEADASAADRATAEPDAKKARKRGAEKIEAVLVELRVKVSKKKKVVESALGRASLNAKQSATLEKGEVVYCPAPPGKETQAGLGSDGLPRICKVKKPIYGMAQAGRRWQRSIFPWFIDQGFTCSSGPMNIS